MSTASNPTGPGQPVEPEHASGAGPASATAPDPRPTPTRVVLKAGTEISVDGTTACLVGETEVETHDHALRAKHTPFEEYPKMIEGGKVVNSAEEEAAWLNPTNADPLADVDIEMDNPDYDGPKKSKLVAKKK